MPIECILYEQYILFKWMNVIYVLLNQVLEAPNPQQSVGTFLVYYYSTNPQGWRISMVKLVMNAGTLTHLHPLHIIRKQRNHVRATIQHHQGISMHVDNGYSCDYGLNICIHAWLLEESVGLFNSEDREVRKQLLQWLLVRLGWGRYIFPFSFRVMPSAPSLYIKAQVIQNWPFLCLLYGNYYRN